MSGTKSFSKNGQFSYFDLWAGELRGDRGGVPSTELPAEVCMLQDEAIAVLGPAWRRPQVLGLWRREREKAGWGWVGTGPPENLAVFTLTLSPPQGAPVTTQGSSSELAGRGIPQTHLHPSLLSELLKGRSSNGASDGEQIQTRRK